MSSVKYSSTGRFVDLVKENAQRSKTVQHPAITINPEGKYIDIDYEEFYNTVSHSASYFYNQLKFLNFLNSRNIGFLSHSDSHYLWNMLGLMSTNVAPVLLSPRNSLEATIHLLKESNSQVLVYQDYFESFAKEAQKHIPDLVLIPKWSAKFPECLSPEDHQLLVPLESKEKELNNIAYILHTSGSTSYPKLIAKFNKVCHSWGHRTRNDCLPYNRKEIIFPPLFHSGGILATAISCVYLMRSVIICPDMAPGSIFSSKMIIDMIKELSPKHMLILPLMVKELIEYCDKVENSEGWDVLRTLDFVRYGGAQLPEFMIQTLFDNRITPISIVGNTECGVLMRSIFYKDSEHLIPLTPAEEMQYTLKEWGDDVVEFIISKDDSCLACVQDRDRDENGNYPTKDLFQVISREPLLLDYLSRADDTIIHVNGEKTNPIPMEDKINQCPYIDVCAILGNGQQMNTLLVQLNLSEVMASPLTEVFSSVMSFVKLANESAPSHSRIYEEMIHYLPIKSEKKLPVTIKGNLQRRLCIELFTEEVKKAVEKIESGYASEESREFRD
jgi:long-subunit acyl-CoA synthetase (AMP-forming)